MSLPAIVAAAAKEALDLSKVGLAGLPVTILAVGLVVSAIVGYITVKFFVRYLANHSLEVFAVVSFCARGGDGGVAGDAVDVLVAP